MEQMSRVLEFMYRGEVSLKPDEVKDFIATARHLSIAGIPNADDDDKEPEVQSISRRLRSSGKPGSKSEAHPICPRFKNSGNNSVSAGPSLKRRRTTEKCLEDLPKEILIRIFSYLPTIDLLRNVAPVCKRFLGLSNDRDAHLVVRLHCDVKTMEAVEFLKKATNIEQLHIGFPSFRSIQMKTRKIQMQWHVDRKIKFCDQLLLAVAGHPKVRVIHIVDECMSLTMMGFVNLSRTGLFESLIKFAVPIDTATRHQSDPKKGDLKAAILSFSTAKNLQHLDLGQKTYSRDDSIVPDLLSVGLTCKHLQQLAPTLQFTSADHRTLIQARQGSLQKLKLDDFRSENPNTFFHDLADCSKLKTLEFICNEAHLGILKNLTAVRKAKLFVDCRLSDDEYDFSADLTPNCLSHLDSLNVECYEKIQHLNFLLRLPAACPNLKTLHCRIYEISHERLAEQITKALRQFLMTCLHLETVQIRVGNHRGEVNFSQILNAAGKHLANLGFLQLHEDCWSNRPPPVSKDQIGKVLESLPSLTGIVSQEVLYVRPKMTLQEIGKLMDARLRKIDLFANNFNQIQFA